MEIDELIYRIKELESRVIALELQVKRKDLFDTTTTTYDPQFVTISSTGSTEDLPNYIRQ